MLDKTATIEAFLEGAAAKRPTPGGGAVAALAGALAAAMGEMVLNYSVGKKGLEEHEAELQSALAGFHTAREVMLNLMHADQDAFEALTLAKKIPTDDPKRELSVNSATMLCLEVPWNMAVRAVLIISLVNDITDKANRYLLSDLAVCAELAMATVRAAICNVRANLPNIADEQMRRDEEKRCNDLLSQVTDVIRSVIPRIWDRISKSQK